MPQRILDRLFLLRRAMRDNTIHFADVVVLALLNAGLLLHLCDVERRDLKSVFLFHICFDVVVGTFLRDYLLFLLDIEIIQINLD